MALKAFCYTGRPCQETVTMEREMLSGWSVRVCSKLSPFHCELEPFDDGLCKYSSTV